MTSSSFRLVYGDYEFAVPLYFDASSEEQLVARMRLAEEADPDFAQLGKRLSDAIAQSLDVEVIPPSKKQLDYALAICKELGIQLPAECIQFQESIRVFLSRHAPEYQRRKGYRSGGAV